MFDRGDRKDKQKLVQGELEFDYKDIPLSNNEIKRRRDVIKKSCKNLWGIIGQTHREVKEVNKENKQKNKEKKERIHKVQQDVENIAKEIQEIQKEINKDEKHQKGREKADEKLDLNSKKLEVYKRLMGDKGVKPVSCFEKLVGASAKLLHDLRMKQNTKFAVERVDKSEDIKNNEEKLGQLTEELEIKNKELRNATGYCYDPLRGYVYVGKGKAEKNKQDTKDKESILQKGIKKVNKGYKSVEGSVREKCENIRVNKSLNKIKDWDMEIKALEEQLKMVKSDARAQEFDKLVQKGKDLEELRKQLNETLMKLKETEKNKGSKVFAKEIDAIEKRLSKIGKEIVKVNDGKRASQNRSNRFVSERENRIKNKIRDLEKKIDKELKTDEI